MGKKNRTIKERFDSKYIVNESGCWIWTGAPSKHNYGQIQINGRSLQAANVGYTLYKGEIPKGMSVCHKCDVTMCVNPDHLFLGTRADNSRDMVLKNRSCFGERHPKAKLRTEFIPIIREAYTHGFTLKSIADYYKVRHTTIHRILKGQIWLRA